MTEPDLPPAEIVDAAAAATAETKDAISKAAEVNDDPAVAEHLADAAIAAEKTDGRVGWLRSFIHRHFRSSRD